MNLLVIPDKFKEQKEFEDVMIHTKSILFWRRMVEMAF